MAELEAIYGFLGNEAIDAAAVLAPHRRASVERATQWTRGVVVAVHASTAASFGGGSERGVGHLANRTPGFVAHFCLGVGSELGEEGHRQPLGVLGLKRMIRKEPMKGDKGAETKAWRKVPREQKAACRWPQLAWAVDQELGDVRAVHVMDQEANSFANLADLIDEKCRFVVRGSANRNLTYRSRPNI